MLDVNVVFVNAVDTVGVFVASCALGRTVCDVAVAFVVTVVVCRLTHFLRISVLNGIITCRLRHVAV